MAPRIKHVTGLAFCVTAASTAAALSDTGEDHTFRTDSGMYELGYTVLAPEAFIGNYYTVPEGADIEINSVEVALGFGLEGLGYEVIIYNDPDNDGNPINADPLSRTSATVGPDAPWFNILNFQTVDTEPTRVSGGFFVGIWIFEQPFQGLNGDNSDWQTAPSAYRASEGSGSNWVVRPALPEMGGGNEPLDVEDLSQNLQVIQTQLNWVVRASGISVASAMSPDMNGDGVYDMFDVLGFLALYQSGDADFNQDGTTDIFDVLAFITEWRNAA